MPVKKKQKEESPAIKQAREVYSALRTMLGPEHPGTLKAKYALAKAIIDESEADTSEALLLLTELVEDIRKMDGEPDPYFSGIDYYFCTAVFENEEDLNKVISLLESFMDQGPAVVYDLQKPNEFARQYFDMTDMLICAYLDAEDYMNAFITCHSYIENLVRVYRISDECVESAIDQLGDICLAIGDQEIDAEYAQIIDTACSDLMKNVAPLKAVGKFFDNDELEDKELSLVRLADNRLDLANLYRSYIFYSLSAMSRFPSIATKERKKELLEAVTQLEKCYEHITKIEKKILAEEKNDDNFFATFEARLEMDNSSSVFEKMMESIRALEDAVKEKNPDWQDVLDLYFDVFS